MSNYSRGSGSQFQIGKETTWGTKVVPNRLLNFLSESLKLNVERIEEDSLLVQKTARKMDVMGYTVDGDVSVILKPENVKEILYLALGVEAAPALKATTTGVYEHEFTLTDHNASLPSFTAIIDRKASTPAYTGLKVSNLSIEAQSKNFIRATMGLKGKAEEAGTLAVGLSVPTLSSFRFVNGSMTIDAVEFADVTSVNFTIDNKLDDGEYTLGSGIYASEMEHNERMVSISFDCFYNAAADDIREDKYKVDGATAAIVLTFETPDEIEVGEKYTIQIELPKVVITQANPMVSGKEKLAFNISGTALQGVSEPVTITYFDGTNAKAFV